MEDSLRRSATALLVVRRGLSASLRTIQQQAPDNIEAQKRRTVRLDIACREGSQRSHLTCQPFGDLLYMRIGGHKWIRVLK